MRPECTGRKAELCLAEYNFSEAYDIASCERAPFSNPSQPDGCKRRNTHPGVVGFGVCYPQGVVVPELGALFVIASVNPEDIWVLKIPLASLMLHLSVAGLEL